MGFIYPYTVRFRDTDGAGVVFFAQVFALCHQAYEASLGAAGIPLGEFFSAQGAWAFPIIHSSADFRAPLHCGDRLTIQGQPQVIGENRFEITYRIHLHPETDEGSHSLQAALGDRPAATVLTRHCCTALENRRPHPLPDFLQPWLTLTQAEQPQYLPGDWHPWAIQGPRVSRRVGPSP